MWLEAYTVSSLTRGSMQTYRRRRSLNQSKRVFLVFVCINQLSRAYACSARARSFSKNAVTFHNPSVQRHFRRFAPSLSRHFPSQEHPFTSISAGLCLTECRKQLSLFREQLSCRKTVSVWAKTLSAFQKTVTVLLRLSLSCTSLRLTHITEE